MAQTLTLALGFLSAVQALPTWSNAVVKRGAADVSQEYDYIDGKKTVLVIEYGPLSQDDSFMPLYNVPAAQFLYNLTSVPQVNVNNRTFPVANGAVVGGGSAVNGQFFDRGSAEDYNNWAKFSGNSGWDWKGLYPYFKKSSALAPPTTAMQKWGITWDSSAYSSAGPVVGAYPDYQWATQKTSWNAWVEKGNVPIQKEHADGHAYGVFWIPTAMDPARAYNRSFAGLSHYIKVQPRKNYHLLTLHRVTKVNFVKKNGKQQAVSVDVKERYGESTFKVKAKREIILSAAATRTPVLLQYSGIGPKKVLAAANVTTLIDLPGVGANLQDHSFALSLYNFTTDNSFPKPTTIATNATYKAEALELFKKTNGGPYTAVVTVSGAFLPPSTFTGDEFDALVKEIKNQKPKAYLPADTPKEIIKGYARQKEILLASFKSKTNAWLEHPFTGKGWGMCILLKPFSRGSIKINPADPLGDPIFDYRLFSNPLDLKMHIRMQTYIRKHFLESKAFKNLTVVEQDPAPGAVTDDAGWEDWLLNQNKLFASNGHSVGTAAMMPRDEGGVVDNQLRVYGTTGLSIADCSIIPLMPGTHTQTTAYAIGEKAADLIKARNR
ncbi:GMC oxidoreductase [Lentithecium fluviatile CBS 122367]|uniref:GMC oxidoreductase n=1 Tax=Lentithecium fluviatile CBS 122367 TaxID=1168545 RepID=A0A6G1IP50_9PLEO|nr:GMC oxidoreductase [Lentithecium fluviatile CBS 122367]